MMKSVRRPSAAPVYAVGAMWLLYTVLFGLHSVGQYALCAALSVAVYLLFKAKFPGKTIQVEVPEKPPATGNAELDETIIQGRKLVGQIRVLNGEIPGAHVSQQLNEIETVTGKILTQLEQKQDQVRQCRQFLNYYLPTTVKLLKQYVQLQNQGIKDGNVAAAMKKIEALLDKVLAAFRKLLDGLFAADVVDITAEISVMEQLMQAQSLTGDEGL